MSTLGEDYARLIGGAGFHTSGRLEQLFSGSLRLPYSGSPYQPPANYGFPPAMLPVLSDSSTRYWGIWRHWFVPRAPSFVLMSVEDGFRVREIARTPEQFFCQLVLQQLCLFDEVTDEVAAFAAELGVHSIELIDRASLVTGDSLDGLKSLPEFASRRPAVMVSEVDDYDGDFPPFGAGAELATPFELPEGLGSAEFIGTASGRFAGLAQSEFRRAMAAEDLSTAWLALNSPGWSYPKVKAALLELQRRSSEDGFEELVESWGRNMSAELGGY